MDSVSHKPLCPYCKETAELCDSLEKQGWQPGCLGAALRNREAHDKKWARIAKIILIVGPIVLVAVGIVIGKFLL